MYTDSQRADAERKRQQRERTAKSRAKRKEQSAIDAVANEQKSRSAFDAYRVQHRLVSPGEVEAFQNAETCSDALLVAREFLIALNQPDIQAGESLLSAERRVMTAWIEVGAPLLNRNTIRFDAETGSTIDGFTFDFDSKWVPLPGSTELIDVASLPVIEIPTVAEVPAVYTPVTPAIVNDPALKNYRTPEVTAICKAQQDACDADARRIGNRNLERELLREKRLGVAYAYDAE
jgi:hypothetical protein